MLRVYNARGIIAIVTHPEDVALITAAPVLLAALQTIALHAPSLDAQGIRDIADQALDMVQP